jgi:uncharacterized membrane protein
MAGIGFELKKLTSRDNLFGILRAYTHAAMASTGPWLFTVIALAGITTLYSDFFAAEGLLNFRVVVIYNFSFSLVLSAPVFMVVTRYLADAIYRKDVTATPSVMLKSLLLLYAIQIPIAGWFYLSYVNFELSMRLSALANLFLITSVWLLSVFPTALKDYNAVTRAYGIGMVLAVLFVQLFKDPYGDVGMVNGFSIGLAWIVFALAAKIFAEYPYVLGPVPELTSYFKKYWELAVGGICYNAAIWVDKWIMWFAPEAMTLPSKMVMYPDYDSAMFLAYLTIVPAMAVFVFSIETHFSERYQRFYQHILEHMPLSKICENHAAITQSVMDSARNFIVVQGTICFLAVVLAAKIFELININYLQIGMFRLGALGAFFHVLVLFEMIVLSYFDCRRITMWLQAIFLASNAGFTLLSLQWGFAWYGYGYFLSCLLLFVLTTPVLFTYIRRLPYHAFITSNNSVKA